MNLLIHIEIPLRETDSNLLLAAHAVKKGFNVIIGSKIILSDLINQGLIKTGIFHTKTVTHSEESYQFLRKLKKKNFLITSFDQEHGLLNENISDFVKSRIAKRDLNLIDIFFCWGKKDYNYLIKSKNFDSKQKKSFFQTGSPRLEICQSDFKNIWVNKKLKKNITLITNFAFVNGSIPFPKIIKKYRKNGYFDRNKNELKLTTERYKYEKLLIKDFLNLSKFLKNKFIDYNIIVRPHPAESKKFWEKKFFKEKRIIVENSNTINEAINDSFCIINNSCTSSIETAISSVPIINFVPKYYKSKYGSFVNKIGIKAKNFNEISKIIFKLKNTSYKKKNIIQSVKTIEKKILFKNNNNYSASKKVVNLLKKLHKKNIKKKTNFSKFKIKMYILLTSFLKNIIREIVLFLKNKKEEIDDMVGYKNVYFDKNSSLKKIKFVSKKIGLKNYSVDVVNKKAIIFSKNF